MIFSTPNSAIFGLVLQFLDRTCLNFDVFENSTSGLAELIFFRTKTPRTENLKPFSKNHTSLTLKTKARREDNIHTDRQKNRQTTGPRCAVSQSFPTLQIFQMRPRKRDQQHYYLNTKVEESFRYFDWCSIRNLRYHPFFTG